MWDLILALIARLLSRRDDNTVPAALASAGEPDEVEDDRSTPIDVDLPVTPPALLRPPPVFAPPPTVVVAAPPPAQPTSATLQVGISTVGAWCGSRSLAEPQKYVDFARAHRINRFDIVVNDHSKWREPSDFTIYNAAKIIRLAKLAREAGIEVHLMSWIMPHVRYITTAAQILIPLAEATQAASIQWDAEEPWMLARKSMGYERAAALIAEEFRKLPIPLGVNGIGYASVEKLAPLAKVCNYVVPQVYCTSTNGLDPRTAPSKFYSRWHKNFDRPIVMGLAAYRQKGIPGYTEAQAMQSAVEATRALKTVNTVIYWSLYHITKNRAIAKVIATIRDRSPHELVT
jgi:hypothetical protein